MRNVFIAALLTGSMLTAATAANAFTGPQAPVAAQNGVAKADFDGRRGGPRCEDGRHFKRGHHGGERGGDPGSELLDEAPVRGDGFVVVSECVEGGHRSTSSVSSGWRDS